MGKKWIEFFKKEAVLSIAMVLALVSSVVILPDREYLGYIDFRTLGILFCLMAVMAGLQKIGLFTRIAQGLLRRVKSVRMLVLILILLCFFFSMVITNDVALITFVPLTFIVLGMMGEEWRKRLSVPVVVMQTIAANLGSMLTPIGNPQNLYLYGKSGMGLGEFVLLMLPYTVISLILLGLWCMSQKSERIEGLVLGEARQDKDKTVSETEKSSGFSGFYRRSGALAVYLILFVLCILTVARILPYGITLAVVIAAVFCLDRKVLGQVDYGLLLTFVGFFVFIGNMGRIPAFRSFLESIILGNEVLTAVLSSQVISNVPAALLLSGFTENYEALIIGTNLGGLGTLIASMASLISFKYLGKEDKGAKKKYLIYFTLANLTFLAVLLVFWVL